MTQETPDRQRLTRLSDLEREVLEIICAHKDDEKPITNEQIGQLMDPTKGKKTVGGYKTAIYKKLRIQTQDKDRKFQELIDRYCHLLEQPAELEMFEVTPPPVEVEDPRIIDQRARIEAGRVELERAVARARETERRQRAMERVSEPQPRQAQPEPIPIPVRESEPEVIEGEVREITEEEPRFCLWVIVTIIFFIAGCIFAAQVAERTGRALWETNISEIWESIFNPTPTLTLTPTSAVDPTIQVQIETVQARQTLTAESAPPTERITATLAHTPTQTDTPIPPVDLPFTDTFDNDKSNLWTVIGPEPYVVGSHEYATSPVLAADDRTYLFIGNETWTNYMVEASFNSSQEVGIGVRAKGLPSMLLFTIKPGLTKWVIVEAREWKDVARTEVGYNSISSTFGFATFVVTVEDNHISAFVDGEPAGSFFIPTDKVDEYSNGGVAIMLDSNSFIDFVEVSKLP